MKTFINNFKFWKFFQENVALGNKDDLLLQIFRAALWEIEKLFERSMYKIGAYFFVQRKNCTGLLGYY